MIATTMYETNAPASRAVMSKAPPARIASFETVATTSPVECPFLIAGPVRAAWCATICAIRKEAWSQLATAKRCRITPAAAVVAPSPSRISDHCTRAWLSLSTMPVWIALPMAAGMSACETIQTTPKKTPPSRVFHWSRATQSRKRSGDRVSGWPGSVKGSLIMGVAAQRTTRRRHAV